MFSVIAYNILAGGTGRLDSLTAMLRPYHPDLVGLVEASDEHVVAELARRLGMHYRLSGQIHADHIEQGALLSRLPILETTTYTHSFLTKQPLLEVCVQTPDGLEIRVFVIHLTANFYQGRRADWKRRQEVQTIVEIMAAHRGKSHLLMGDFNSVIRKERVRGSAMLRYMLDERLYYALLPAKSRGLPTLDYILPPRWRFLKPALRSVPRNPLLSAWLDACDTFYAPHGGLEILSQAGYIDCFRRLHPHAPGFTWPAALPAGRIDFIFASPELEAYLCACDVLAEGEGVPADRASDHLPVFATFAKAEESPGATTRG